MGERHRSRSGTRGSRGFAIALVLLCPLTPAAFADGAGQPGTASDRGDRSVIGYPESFFATMGLDTAYDMVLRVPGYVFDDGSNVRGFAGSVGNVLIDGQRPASKTDDLISILRRIPASDVERIDFIRGGAPGIDMSGKTMVVNVIRKKDRGFKGVAAVGAYKPMGYPFDPQLRLEGSWNDNGRALEGSIFLARYHDGSQSSGPHVILNPAGQVIDFSEMDNRAVSWQYLGTAAYEAPMLGGKLRLNLTLEDQPYRKFNIDNFTVAGRQVELFRQDVADAELGQHYERDLLPAWSLELIGLEHLNKTDTSSLFDTQTDEQSFDQRNRGGELIGRGIAHWRPSAGFTVDTGGEFAYNWVRTNTLFIDNGTAVGLPAANVLVAERRGEAFATAVLRPSDTLAIEAGLRVEASTISSAGDVALSRTLAFPKPRLVVTWTPDAADQLRFRVEREVGQLDFTNFAANAALNATGVTAGNPNLLPQQDWAVEAAYDRHFWADGVVSLTARHLFLHDVVDQVPVFSSSGVFTEPGNIGGGSENDLIASFNLPLDRFGLDQATLRGIGTWRLSEVRDPTTGLQRAISQQQPLAAELHFSQALPSWNLTWGLDSYPGYRVPAFLFDEIDRTYNGIENTVFVEYRPEPTLTLRLQTDLEPVATDLTRQVFAGLRDASPLLFTDLQRRRFGPITFFRLRKTFD